MAVTDSDEVEQELSLHGSAPTFKAVGYGLHYNFRMTEVTAAVGLGQMERIRGYIESFQAVGRILSDAVEGCRWLVLQKGPEYAVNTYHLWACRFEGDKHGVSKDDLLRVLAEERCEGVFFYTGLTAYRNPVIAERTPHALNCPSYTGKRNRYPDGLCPVAEDLAPRIILASTWISEDQAKRTAEGLRRAVQRMG
jgi:perosamine synthetase